MFQTNVCSLHSYSKERNKEIPIHSKEKVMKSGTRKVRNFRQEQPPATKEIYYKYGTSHLLWQYIPIIRYLNIFQMLCYLIRNQNKLKISDKKYGIGSPIRSKK